jgi:hypothetical protein
MQVERLATTHIVLQVSTHLTPWRVLSS